MDFNLAQGWINEHIARPMKTYHKVHNILESYLKMFRGRGKATKPDIKYHHNWGSKGLISKLNLIMLKKSMQLKISVFQQTLYSKELMRSSNNCRR